MKGIESVLAVLVVIAMTTDYQAQAFPRPQQDVDPNQTAADGFIFDGIADRQEPSRSTSTRRPPFGRTVPPVVTTTPVAVTSTTGSPDVAQCRQNCRFRTTAEYNPVCGTDSQDYSNPGMLSCARNCGLDVSFAYSGPCASAIRG